MRGRGDRGNRGLPRRSPTVPTSSLSTIPSGVDLPRYEKTYFRLTQAPDPKSIRSEALLREWLPILLSLKSQKSYTYLLDQFKSIRQDLTVQAIRNEFALKIYVENINLSIENDDLLESRACLAVAIDLGLGLLFSQSQIISDKESISDEVEDVSAPEDISGDEGDLLSSLVRLVRLRILIYFGDKNHSLELVGFFKGLPPSILEAEPFQAALRLFALVLEKNYFAFFKSLSSLLPLESAVLKLTGFMEEFRLESLRVILTAYRASGLLELPFVLASLGFKDLSELTKFCEKRKIDLVLNDSRDFVDLKKSRMDSYFPRSNLWNNFDFEVLEPPALPLELFAEILSLIGSPRDVQSFGLCCRSTLKAFRHSTLYLAIFSLRNFEKNTRIWVDLGEISRQFDLIEGGQSIHAWNFYSFEGMATLLSNGFAKPVSDSMKGPLIEVKDGRGQVGSVLFTTSLSPFNPFFLELSLDPRRTKPFWLDPPFKARQYDKNSFYTLALGKGKDPVFDAEPASSYPYNSVTVDSNRIRVRVDCSFRRGCLYGVIFDELENMFYVTEFDLVR